MFAVPNAYSGVVVSLFNRSVGDAVETGGGVGADGSVITIGPGDDEGAGPTWVRPDTVTTGAGRATPRVQAARSRTTCRPRQNMSS